MKEVLEFMDKAKVLYLATSVDGQPHVRPLGFVMEWNGKLAFSTSNQKAMYKQMAVNPKVEICCYDGAGNTMRICGKAVFATSEETQGKALEVMPPLSNLYSVGDGIFEIFYIDEAKAVCCDMAGNSQELAV